MELRLKLIVIASISFCGCTLYTETLLFIRLLMVFFSSFLYSMSHQVPLFGKHAISLRATLMKDMSTKSEKIVTNELGRNKNLLKLSPKIGIH